MKICLDEDIILLKKGQCQINLWFELRPVVQHFIYIIGPVVINNNVKYLRCLSKNVLNLSLTRLKLFHEISPTCYKTSIKEFLTFDEHYNEIYLTNHGYRFYRISFQSSLFEIFCHCDHHETWISFIHLF